MFSLFLIPASLTGQINGSMKKSYDLKNDTTYRDKKFNNKSPVYHFNEIRKTPEMKTWRDDKRIFEFNKNRRYMQPEKRNIFKPGYTVESGYRKYSLIGDNMPCLVPTTNGYLRIIK